ncbi:hypothetical protein [Telluribacter sp. SYSU D00476]|uniref:hypothetical protein n=1 Tax=Telluribacter sp. SYSU D00476 TaxID=2811430 RepID=UPI001FF29317|nr:hypothetical protein [Telluribacter sp. SYSU D00476]
MKEDNIDDLFRSNAEYLADQPHRDFNADLFWQQLQPELPKTTTRPKRVAWWYWATAAAVLLAVGISIDWWKEPATLRKNAGTIVQQVPAQQQTAPGTEVPSHVEAPATGAPSERMVTQVQPEKSKKVPGAESLTTPSAPAQEYRPEPPLIAATSSPATEVPDSRESDSLLNPVTAAPKPAYRIVHRNELMQQEKHESKARTQVVLRVGLPAAAESDLPSSRKPIAIPLFN